MKEKTTYEIIIQLTNAMKTQNQELINIYAYELTTRLYVPNTKTTFDELLYGFGYRKSEIDSNQISIEEYMRNRKKE